MIAELPMGFVYGSLNAKDSKPQPGARNHYQLRDTLQLLSVAYTNSKP